MNKNFDTITFTSRRQAHHSTRVPGCSAAAYNVALVSVPIHLPARLPTTNLQGTGEASRTVLRRALESVGMEFGPTTPEQALITLMRAAGGDSNSAPYEAVVDRLDEPGGFQHGL